MLFWSLLSFISALLFILNDKRLSLYVLICITTISAFRFQVGSDFNSYLMMFDVISLDIYHLWQNKEVGYLTLIRLVSGVGGNQQFIFALISICISLLYYRGVSWFCKDFGDSKIILCAVLVIYLFQVYFPSFNQIRQYLVFAIFCFSLRYYCQSRYLLYVALMLFATTIHFTAFLVLLASLVFKINLSDRKYFYVLIFLLLLTDPMRIIIDSYISLELPYYQYFTIEGLIGKSSTISVISSYIMLFLYCVVVFVDKSKFRNEQNYIILSNLSLLFIVVKILGADFEIINRVSNYFKVFFYLHLFVFTLGLEFKYARVKSVLVFLSLFALVASGVLSVALRAHGDPTYSNVDFNLCIFGEYCSINSYY